MYVYIYIFFNYTTFAKFVILSGYNEQGEGGPTSANASRFHRFHLSTHLRGLFCDCSPSPELCRLLTARCFQAFAMLSDKLEPLVEGVRRNKQHWLDKAMSNHVDVIDENMAETGFV